MNLLPAFNLIFYPSENIISIHLAIVLPDQRDKSSRHHRSNVSRVYNTGQLLTLYLQAMTTYSVDVEYIATRQSNIFVRSGCLLVWATNIMMTTLRRYNSAAVLLANAWTSRYACSLCWSTPPQSILLQKSHLPHTSSFISCPPLGHTYISKKKKIPYPSTSNTSNDIDSCSDVSYVYDMYIFFSIFPKIICTSFYLYASFIQTIISSVRESLRNDLVQSHLDTISTLKSSTINNYEAKDIHVCDRWRSHTKIRM